METRDVIVLDQERFPKIADWGTFLGNKLGLEFYIIDDIYWDYIPHEVTYLRFDYKTADYGYRYWGETRKQRSSYGSDEEGTTIKSKENVPDVYSEYVNPFMEAVIALAVQEIFEKRYSDLRTNYSYLEEVTWADQLAESEAYIADSTVETKLIHRLAEVRGLTTEAFASKVVKKQSEWKEKLYDLAVQEQKVIATCKSCANVQDVNLFLEDYFGIPLSNDLCLAYGRCTRNDETNVVIRKIPAPSGIQF